MQDQQNNQKPIRIEMLSPDVIDTSPRYWRPEVPMTEREIKQEMAVISASPRGSIEPIVVWQSAEGPNLWNLVEGEVRLEACRRLKWATVPARIMEGTEVDVGIYLLRKCRKSRGKAPQLEQSWCAVGLMDQGGATQRELADRLGVLESKVSEDLKIGRAVTEAVAQAIASEMDIAMRNVLRLSRDTLRVIAKEKDLEQRDRLLREAITACQKPSRTSRREVPEPAVEPSPTISWRVKVNRWMERLQNAIVQAVQKRRSQLTVPDWLIRILNRST